MEIFEGIAAFAILMVMFSTVVSGIVEIILRLLATRQEVLIKSIERLVSDELVPWARDRFDADGNGVIEEDEVKAFTEGLTLNPLLKKGIKPLFFKLGRYGHQTITTYSLLQRLAKSKVGDAIAKLAEDEKRALLTNLGRTYERYAAAASEQFRVRAHLWTTVVAIVFAFSVNIDAGRLFTHLMKDEGARNALIENAPEAKAENEAAAAALAKELTDSGVENADEIVKRVSGISASVGELKEEFSLPIGAEYFPYCRLKIEGTVLSFDSKNCTSEEDRTLLTWFLFTLLAGMLIGLGGPFWYKVYTSLSQVASITRLLKGGEVISEKSSEQPASKAALEEDIVKTFDTARAGRAGNEQ